MFIKLGISHYVLIRATEAIHISTVTLAFSVLILLAHIKNTIPINTHIPINTSLYFLRVYGNQWGTSGFLFIDSGFADFFVEMNWKGACDLIWWLLLHFHQKIIPPLF